MNSNMYLVYLLFEKNVPGSQLLWVKKLVCVYMGNVVFFQFEILFKENKILQPKIIYLNRIDSYQ